MEAAEALLGADLSSDLTNGPRWAEVAVSLALCPGFFRRAAAKLGGGRWATFGALWWVQPSWSQRPTM